MKTTQFRIVGIALSMALFVLSIWLVAVFGSWTSFANAVSVWAVAVVIVMFVLSMWLLIVSIVADGQDVKKVLSAFEAGDAIIVVLPVFLFEVTKKIFRGATSNSQD